MIESPKHRGKRGSVASDTAETPLGGVGEKAESMTLAPKSGE